MKKRFTYNFIAVIAVVLILSNVNAFAATENVTVSLPSFKVTLNGSEINNDYSKYPLIAYKDITYFPMTYSGARYLGLETKWEQEKGLEINKTNIAPEVSEEGLLLYEFGNRVHETDNYRYMITSNIYIDNDSQRIYKLNKSTKEITLVNEKPAETFKYRNERLYFVSEDRMLYSLSLIDETVRLESKGPIRRDKYEVLGNDIYYISDKDQKVYKEGDKEALNFGETAEGEVIRLRGDYIVLTFNTTLDYSYRSLVYDKTGDTAFIYPRRMKVVSTDSNKMAYFDEVEKKVFLVEMK